MNGDHDDKPYLIWSFEHEAWWGPFRAGYVTDSAVAGRYMETEARQIVDGAMGQEVMVRDERNAIVEWHRVGRWARKGGTTR